MTLARVKPEPWMASAACREDDVDSEWFYPPDGGSTEAAKQVCWQPCPVRRQCLDYALARGERFGVWGGKSERERRRIARGESGQGQAHGTHASYKRGCRCDECREFMSAFQRARREARRPVAVCEWCRNVFKPLGARRFCSGRCRGAHRSAQRSAS